MCLRNILRFADIPKTNLHYMTTYQAAQYDYLRIDHTGIVTLAFVKIKCCLSWNSIFVLGKRTAGVPSHRFDIPHVTVPPGQCSADKDSLGAETTCVGVLNPSIFTNYGLSHRDFFMVKKVFNKLNIKKIQFVIFPTLFC